jgi:hypothetical protein
LRSSKISLALSKISKGFSPKNSLLTIIFALKDGDKNLDGNEGERYMGDIWASIAQ